MQYIFLKCGFGVFAFPVNANFLVSFFIYNNVFVFIRTVSSQVNFSFRFPPRILSLIDAGG